jgi:hypothetical protein
MTVARPATQLAIDNASSSGRPAMTSGTQTQFIRSKALPSGERFSFNMPTPAYQDQDSSISALTPLNEQFECDARSLPSRLRKK